MYISTSSLIFLAFFAIFQKGSFFLHFMVKSVNGLNFLMFLTQYIVDDYMGPTFTLFKSSCVFSTHGISKDSKPYIFFPDFLFSYLSFTSPSQ